MKIYCQILINPIISAKKTVLKTLPIWVFRLQALVTNLPMSLDIKTSTLGDRLFDGQPEKLASIHRRVEVSLALQDGFGL